MKTIRKIIKWILLLILGIVVLFLLNLAWHRMRGPTQEELAALSFVEAPVAKPQGRNAFALMWLFGKDVSDTDIDRLAAQDVEYARASEVGSNEQPQFPSAKLPDLEVPKPGLVALCDSAPADCLTLMRNNHEATRDLLAKHGRLLQRASELENFEYFDIEFPHGVSMPFTNSVRSQQLRISQLALMFDDGERSEAMTGVCRNLSMWRRFGRDNHSLIQTMLASSRRDAAMQLFAAMLAEWKPEESIPADCAIALAPIAADEVSMCSSLLGEFDTADAMLESMVSTGQSAQNNNWFERSAQPLVLDLPQLRAWRARKVAANCVADDSARALQDLPSEWQPLDIGWLDCASNMVGCILIGTAAPAYDDYQERLLDSAAHLRLAATLAWLRKTEGSGQSLQQRFDSRPDALRSGSRATGITEDGRSIWVDNLFTQRAARFSLPLAASKETAP